MKKKLFAGLLALAFACLALPGAMAQDAEEGQTYTLGDIGFTVTLPDELIVLGPDLVPVEEAAAELMYEPQVVEVIYENLKATNVQLAALSSDVSWELDVAIWPDVGGDLVDYRQFPKASRQMLLDQMLSRNGMEGFNRENASFYELEQALFIRFSMVQSNGNEAIRYCTIYDGDLILVDLVSMNGALTQEQKEIAEKVLDGSSFTKESVYTTRGIYVLSVLPPVVRELILFFFPLAVYCLPMLLYRFGVRRAPVKRWKACVLALIWGVVAYFLLMALFSWLFGTNARSDLVTLVIGGVVNYFLLTKGGKKKGSPAPDGEGPGPLPSPDAVGQQEGIGFDWMPPQATDAPAGQSPAAPVTEQPAHTPASPATAQPAPAPEAPAPEQPAPAPAAGPVPASQAPAEPTAPAAVPEPEAPAPQTPTPAGEAAEKKLPPIRFCRYCGARLKEDGLFCTQCGARVRDQ